MTTILVNCLHCNKPFHAKLKYRKRGMAKFCNRSCFAQYEASKRKKQNTILCSHCSQPFHRIPSKRLSKSGLNFCSRSCKDAAQCFGGDIQPSHYGTGSTYRKKAFELYPHKCAHCGYDEYPEALEVHHIDENRHNNKPENLSILCAICHILLHRKIINIKQTMV